MNQVMAKDKNDCKWKLKMMIVKMISYLIIGQINDRFCTIGCLKVKRISDYSAKHRRKN